MVYPRLTDTKCGENATQSNKNQRCKCNTQNGKACKTSISVTFPCQNKKHMKTKTAI